MKKKLTLLAALVALAPCAMAQSSVTLFGVLDAAVTHAKGSVASRTSLSSGNWAISRLGFRGVEDLGGGLSAGFWLEAGVMADTGTGFATNTNNQASGLGTAGGLVFNRRSTVSLMGPFGELRAGRDVQPHYWNFALYDPFGHVGIGAPILLNSTVGGLTNSWVRASNSVHYITPANLGGFFGQVAYFMGENSQNGAANEKDGTGYSIRVAYQPGPLNVGLGYMRTKYATGDITHYSLGASYDFGPVKIMGVALRDKVDSALPDGRGWEVGLTAPVGPHEFKAQVSRYNTNALGEPTSSKISAGYAYNLSKRSAVYLIAARLKNSGGAAQSLAGSVAGPNGKSTGLDIGIKHAF